MKSEEKSKPIPPLLTGGKGKATNAGDNIGTLNEDYEANAINKAKSQKRRSSLGTAAFELADLGAGAFQTIRKNIAQNKPLAFFFLFTLFEIAFFVHEVWSVKIQGFTPTDNSEEAVTRIFLTCVSFIVVATFGFILLTCRIRNLILGVLYMFLVVFVMNYGILSLSRATGSLIRDDFSRCLTQFKSDYDNRRLDDLESKEDFYNKIQQTHHCCGWGTDVLESWPPIYVNTSSLVDSCCIDYIKGCAQNTTRTKASQSGHTIIISESKLSIPQKVRLYGKKYKWDRYHFFKESLHSLRRELLEPTANVGTEGVTYGSVISTNTSNNTFSPVTSNNTGPNTTTLTLTRPPKYYYTLSERLKQRQFRKIDYSQTEVGIHVGLTHFWEVTPKQIPITFWDRYMFYLSKGLIEGIIFQDYIFHKRCEKIAVKNSSDHIPRLNLSYRHYEFFIGIIRLRMQYVIAVSSASITMIIILAVFFWSFYSKMKAEEISHLAPPGDFDLLNLQLPNYDELNEREAKRRRRNAKRKQDALAEQKEKAHIAVAIKLAKVYNQSGLQDPGGDTAGAADWSKPRELTRKRNKIRTRRRDNAEKTGRDRPERKIRRQGGLDGKSRMDLNAIAGRGKRMDKTRDKRRKKTNAIAPQPDKELL